MCSYVFCDVSVFSFPSLILKVNLFVASRLEVLKRQTLELARLSLFGVNSSVSRYRPHRRSLGPSAKPGKPGRFIYSRRSASLYLFDAAKVRPEALHRILRNVLAPSPEFILSMD
jgi:hypothetical protein